ncbi:MAG: response regulator, partial [Gammaproteobacteria bacterium]|nr:response regulator [Gammaproteobacteria bacterium]
MSKSGIQPAGWRAWALAGLLLAGGLALRLAFDPLLGERYPFGTIYLIVGIVGWFVGFAPAVAVAVLGFLCGNVLFVEPRGTLFDGGEKDAVELAFFLLICAGSLLLVRRIHQRESSLRTAELAHARALAELELVTGLMTTGVVRGDRDHRYLWANRAYLGWLNRSIDQLRGTPIAEVIGATGFARVRPHLERALAGESFEVEEPVVFRTLGRRWIHSAYTPVVGQDGAVEGWVAVVNDVTHRHELEEELRQASRRKDEFIATLAHELRNPLAPIRYAIQVFRPGTPAATMADARRMIDRQLAHMSRLLDDLLDVSRVTRGALELRRGVLDLRTLIESAVEAAQPLAHAAGHGIDVNLPSSPLPVDGDATRLVQVIGNLLSNAVRFTPAGGRIVVTATIEPGTPGAGGADDVVTTTAGIAAGSGAVAPAGEPPPTREEQIVVRIRDNGIGIAPELLARIFQPFVQGERSCGPTGGLGIGLSLARQLATLHGGRLGAASAGPGRGSEFTLRLPRAAQDHATAAGPRPSPDRVVAPGDRCRRLLIVDDNVDAADSLAQMLRLAGFETRVAYDGRTAIEIAELMRPDAVLLDLGLPLMSGHDVARRLRGQPWGHDLRLIAVTGWGQEDDRARSRDAGFDEHLTKPVD